MSRISRLFRSTSTRPQSAHKARFGIVALEGRDVPSTLFSNGVLSVAGTTGNDSIEIFSAQANQTRVVVNGHVDFDGAVAISQIKINGREGLDNVNVHGIQAGVTDGVHVINVETVNVADQDPLTGQKSTASIRSNLSVENANFLLVNNSAATANAHLEISDTQVTGIAPATISYTFNDPNATLILQTGAGSDTLNVNNTPVGTTILNGKGGVDNFNVVGTTGAVQINGGTGADNIHIVPTTSTLADIGGQITVSDGLFQDKVDINDIRAGSQASSLSAYSATLSADRLVRTDTEVFQSGPFHFFRDDSDTIVYQGVASVRFVASFTETPSSTVSVLSTNAGTKTTIVPEETQFVTFGNLSHRLDSIDGPVTVQDGRAHTQLVFDDVGTLFGQRYTLGADTVQRNGMATVTLDHFPGQLEVNAGRRADVFNVTAPRTGDFFRTLDGNGGSDILIAPHGDNDWKILGQNLGLLNLSTTFIDVDSLDGSAGADTFNFANGVGVSGKIDGAGGFDTLNYSDYTTGVNVNLTTGSATNVAGGVARILNVFGGSASDSLTGDTGNNVLLGNGGDDKLNGGTGGRDLLVGGNGSDKLVKTAVGDTIYIGADLASTDASNVASVRSIMAEWTSTHSYNTRVTHLQNGTGLTDGVKLNADVLHGDGLVDSYTAGAGRDLFFRDSIDTFAGVLPATNEKVIDV